MEGDGRPGRRRYSSTHHVARDQLLSSCHRLPNIFMHRHLVCLAVIVTVVCAVSGVLFSIWMSFNVLVSFVGSVLLIHRLFGTKFQSFLRLIENNYFDAGNETKKASICPTLTCERNNTNPHVGVAWEQLMEEIFVSVEVDQALEQLLQLTVEKYIETWHQDITDEGSFLHELKDSIRCIVAALIRRSRKVNLPRLITRKLIRAGLSHLDSCLQSAHGEGCEIANLEDSVFEYYGQDLHVAVHSRTSELRYLHDLCGRIMPYLLPYKYLKCSTFNYLMRELFGSMILLSVMDLIAEPNVINSLLVILFDKTPMIRFPPSLLPKVPLLEKFVNISPERCRSRLGLEVTSRTCSSNEAPHLYPFMLYLKNEGFIGLLQFCLAVDDFNVKLLNPDLTDGDLRSLHQEAKKLFDVYMSPDGVDRLNFIGDIVDEFRTIVEGPYKEVVRLQTTEPLYKAYEYAFGLLEKNIPLFCRSEEYFEHLCGKRIKEKSAKGANKSVPRKGLSTAAKIGNKINKIRGALMPTSAIDGRIEDDLVGDITDAGFEVDEMKLDVDSSYSEIDDIGVRDLSAWRIGVPHVQTRRDENEKFYFVFVIDVQRIDIINKDNPDHWVVERKYDEFYVLESKLMEFHGGFVDIHLPAKRSFGNKGMDFMESRRAAFEEFLQRLLQKPTFRGSELLFTFLTSTGDFTKSLLPDINLGRIIKNVPMKLLKERGRHLDAFLQNFIASTEAQTPKQSNTEYKDIYCYPLSAVARRLQKSIYADNAGKRPKHMRNTPLRSNTVLPHRNICDYIVYLWLKVLQMPFWTLNLVLSFAKCFGALFEALVETYLEVQLKEALIPQRIVTLVHLLQDAIFPKDTLRRLEEVHRKVRQDEALTAAKEYLPRLLVNVIGQKRHDVGFERLFQLVQQPRINKQLFYTLLDIVVLELFPELDNNAITADVSEVASASGDQLIKPLNGNVLRATSSDQGMM